jgi:DNA-binding transcriptional MerR regulator
MEDNGDQRDLLSIGELAAKTGVSRRTVRYYVQQGLIPGPVGRGRGSGYTQDHVDRILQIRQLQRNGVQLRTIRQLPNAASAGATGGSGQEDSCDAFPATSVVRIDIAPGIRLELAAGRDVPDPSLLRAIRDSCRNILRCYEEGGPPTSH